MVCVASDAVKHVTAGDRLACGMHGMRITKGQAGGHTDKELKEHEHDCIAYVQKALVCG